MTQGNKNLTLDECIQLVEKAEGWDRVGFDFRGNVDDFLVSIRCNRGSPWHDHLPDSYNLAVIDQRTKIEIGAYRIEFAKREFYQVKKIYNKVIFVYGEKVRREDPEISARDESLARARKLISED